MSRDLTNSSIERQNVLNNPYAVSEIQKAARIQGIVFEDKVVVLKDQIAVFFEVTPRTIDNYLKNFEAELKQNGYEVLSGNRLKKLKKATKEQFVNETDFINKKTALRIFDFGGIDNNLLQGASKAILKRKHK